MTDANQGLRLQHTDLLRRDKALSPFLYIGEKLRSLYQGQGQGQPPADAKGEPSPPIPPEGAEALFRAIEGDIIPRLLLAHKAREAPAPAARGPELTAEDHEAFLHTLRTASATATRRFVEALLQRGVPQETVFLELLTRAARRLGELWDEDRADFSEVTIGLCRLHQVLREQSHLGDPVRATGPDAPRVLLTTACADQHAFGLVLVAEFFRRARWSVWSEPGAAVPQLSGLLQDERFDVLGLSAACTALAEDVAAEIRSFRKASRNTDLKVLVGGRLFAEEPQLVDYVGADGVAFDARSAPDVGRELLAGVVSHC